jgi:hypothetical protein
MAQDRVQWRDLLNTVMNLCIPQNLGFSLSVVRLSFLMDPEAPVHLSDLYYGAKLQSFPQVLLIHYHHEPHWIRLQPSRCVLSTSSKGIVDLVARVVCIPHLL